MKDAVSAKRKSKTTNAINVDQRLKNRITNT